MTGVVVALGSEARTLRSLVAGGGYRVARGGVGSAGARGAAESLAHAGVRRLLVWGVAGGLVTDLEGSLLLPTSVVGSDGAVYPVDAAWHRDVASVLGAGGGGRLVVGALATADTPVATPAARRELAARTGAVAVDMEAAAVAEVARRRSLPVLVVRSVLDTEATPWPEALGFVGRGSGWGWRVLGAAVVGVRDWPSWPAVVAGHRDACRRLRLAAQRLAAAPPG